MWCLWFYKQMYHQFENPLQKETFSWQRVGTRLIYYDGTANPGWSWADFLLKDFWLNMVKLNSSLSYFIVSKESNLISCSVFLLGSFRLDPHKFLTPIFFWLQQILTRKICTAIITKTWKPLFLSWYIVKLRPSPS